MLKVYNSHYNFLQEAKDLVILEKYRHWNEEFTVIIWDLEPKNDR